MPLCGVRWIWDCERSRQNLDVIGASVHCVRPRTIAKMCCHYLRLRARLVNTCNLSGLPPHCVVRHLTPRGQAIGPDVGDASAKPMHAQGSPYTGAHLLRHTMASRLLAGGSSSKRSPTFYDTRSLGTTLIYAKLDSRNLVAVALGWPGAQHEQDLTDTISMLSPR